jgi:ParB-like chromosome segregation protein Spo0J
MLSNKLKKLLLDEYAAAEDKFEFIGALRELIHLEMSPNKAMPVDYVRWVPVEKVFANDYNPNSVARNEMKLLYHSIASDGYTQPTVTIYDPEKDRYVIVDGFHRYLTMKTHEDIAERCSGRLPVVVIDKPINDRMASTVRHNRARGKHAVTGMANMVFEMLDGGWSDAHICNELGLEPEELIRLKHITGFSKLFENYEYSKAWESRNQIKLRIEAQKKELKEKQTKKTKKK